MTEEAPIKISLMSGAMTCATILLCNNAFPDEVKPLAEVVEKRLAILVHNADRVRYAVEHELADFEGQVHNMWHRFHELSAEFRYVVVAERTESNSALQSVLYEFKAFLDLYARLIVQLYDLVGMKTQVDGFGKSVVGGRELSGAKLFNWLRRLPATHPEAARLADLIQRHSEEWISEAVHFRDTVGHRYELSGISDVVVVLPRPLPLFPATAIAAPHMPSGVPLEDYALSLIEKLFHFIDETVGLLPNVNRSFFGHVPEAQRYLPWNRDK